MPVSAIYTGSFFKFCVFNRATSAKRRQSELAVFESSCHLSNHYAVETSHYNVCVGSSTQQANLQA